MRELHRALRSYSMDAFAPEFSAYWLNLSGQAVGHENDDHENESLSTLQQIALEELAERVLAARSVV
jgi:hypothetical protein